MLNRTVYTADHEAYRLHARRFLETHAVPKLSVWRAQGYPEREFWRLAGREGFLGHAIATEYAGTGRDKRDGAIMREEMARVGITGTGLGMMLHADVIAPFLTLRGSKEQKAYWLPRMARGDVIAAIAITEPGAGSDVQGIATRATRAGDEWIVRGTKTLITNGFQADLIITAVKTDPGSGAKGISLLLIEAGRAGFSRKRLRKVGLHYEDAAELQFDDVRVPATHLLGEENRGFGYLMHGMAWERLQIALMGVAASEALLDLTLRHVQQRRMFGQSLIDLQNTRFRLAECVAETRIARHYVDRCLEAECTGTLDGTDAAIAKYFCTELQGRVADLCMQLHGGHAYLADHPVCRGYADARVTRIYGGATEVMKEIIAHSFTDVAESNAPPEQAL